MAKNRQIIEARFRVSGKKPELWDALTGEIRQAKAFSQQDGLTTLPLTLEPYGTVFVVFHTKMNKDKPGTEKRDYPDFKTIQDIAGDEMFPHNKQLTHTNIVLINDFRGRPRREIPLEPSGLLGPVKIVEAVMR